MANYREYNARLETMRGMHRVTSTMKMVAASHLHRMQTELSKPKLFSDNLITLIPVARLKRFAKHRLRLPPPERGSKVLLIIMSSDRGLCGAFNNSIAKTVREWYSKQNADRAFAKVDTLYVGQKGYRLLHAQFPTPFEVMPMLAHPQVVEAKALTHIAMPAFLKHEYDEIWVANNVFVNAMTQTPEVRCILPNVRPPSPAKKLPPKDTPPPRIIEPRNDLMIENIAYLWTSLAFYYSLLNAATSEHAARVMAMDNATTNLQRMEKELILQRNRSRQAQITNELTEIVSGAEALK